MAPLSEKPVKTPSWTSLQQEARSGFLGQEKKPFTGKMTTMPKLPRPLDLEEKKYMLAVEKGDIAATKRILLRAKRTGQPNVNCRDPLGRTALNLAIDAEDLAMVELLVVMGVQTNDALLHAIAVGFVEGVELLLEYEEIVHKSGEPYSWEKVERNIANYTPDITPLILAAHKNNYEILKLLIDRGATIPMPHDIRCGCEDCVESSSNDSLRHSMARINAYRALSSPSLIALSSTDPILTAFELSWELKNLAYTEQEFKAEYTELRRQCMSFAEALLNQTRSSQELAIILNYDPHTDVPYQDGDHMKLARLELAIDYKQKKFVAHPHIQQLLASLWYDGLPGFRRKMPLMKAWEIFKIAVLFPYYCMVYMIAPHSGAGKLMKKPFMKFLIHSSSYLFFLFLLILMSQRVEQQLIDLIMGIGDDGDPRPGKNMKIQRGLGPTITETAVLLYTFGFIWEETKELWSEGLRSYLNDLWNAIDVSRNSLYIATFVLRIYAYVEQTKEVKANQAMAFLPREMWDPYDAQLISEGLCAAANVLSALKLVHMFSINPYLGPLQVSLGRMVIDIIKFLLIYTLVLFAFACGLNQLLWYFADLEKQVCFSLPGGLPDWENNSSACMNWRRFANLFEATQSLFWATFGLWGLEAFHLKGIQNYTRFWAMLMFGCYSIINVVVLLNLLIAMMSHSFTVITEKADSEWKFARTELWLKYFEPGSTVPPPFNLVPTPKTILRLLKGNRGHGRNLKSFKKDNENRERDYRHMAVMRALVWRYIIQQQRAAEDREVTEDDISEVKNDISSLRCELLEIFRCSGFDVDNVLKKGMFSNAVCRKSRIWERRLLKDFHVAPVAGTADKTLAALGQDEGPKERFRRAARTVMGKQHSVHQKWALIVRQAQTMCHIGSTQRSAIPHRQSLKKAMEEARRLIQARSAQQSPLLERSSSSPGAVSPVITTSAAEGRRLLEILRSPMAERGLQLSDSASPQPPTPGNSDMYHLQQRARQQESSTTGTFLTVPSKSGAPSFHLTAASDDGIGCGSADPSRRSSDFVPDELFADKRTAAGKEVELVNTLETSASATDVHGPYSQDDEADSVSESAASSRQLAESRDEKTSSSPSSSRPKSADAATTTKSPANASPSPTGERMSINTSEKSVSLMNFDSSPTSPPPPSTASNHQVSSTSPLDVTSAATRLKRVTHVDDLAGGLQRPADAGNVEESASGQSGHRGKGADDEQAGFSDGAGDGARRRDLREFASAENANEFIITAGDEDSFSPQPPPLPGTKPPVSNDQSASGEYSADAVTPEQAHHSPSKFRGTRSLDDACSSSSRAATACMGRRSMELDPELRRPSLMEDEDGEAGRPQPDISLIHQDLLLLSSAGCEGDGSLTPEMTFPTPGSEEEPGKTADGHQRTSPGSLAVTAGDSASTGYGGLRNIRKPSTSSLEQVVVRLDGRSDHRLDMDSGKDDDIDDEAVGGPGMGEIDEEHGQLRSGRAFESDEKSTSTVSGPVSQPSPSSENSGSSLRRFGLHRGMLEQYGTSSESTEYLIPPASSPRDDPRWRPSPAVNGDQQRSSDGASAEGNDASQQQPASSPPRPVFRAEWQDVEWRRPQQQTSRERKPKKSDSAPGRWI